MNLGVLAGAALGARLFDRLARNCRHTTMVVWARLFGLLALICSMASASGTDISTTASIKFGAIRWDRWYEDSPETRVLEQDKWHDRIPFFARRDRIGHLVLDGDLENTAAAEVAYARGMGIDYFIFGFYPDTGSWNRSRRTSAELDRALVSYLRLGDHLGVKFAVSLNQLFPVQDTPDVIETIVSLMKQPDYVRTDTGTLPLFLLAQDGSEVSRAFGSDEQARAVFSQLRAAVEKSVGAKLTIILMHYDYKQAEDARARYGLDMLSTYTNFSPGKGQQSFQSCIKHQANVWAAPLQQHLAYLPNITIGWDSRPRGDYAVAQGEPAVQRSWCGEPTQGELDQLFNSARAAAAQIPAEAPFHSIVVYAWNEFTEGGWLAPTWDNPHRPDTVRRAIATNRPMDTIRLTFPEPVEFDECPIRSTGRSLKRIADCRRAVLHPAPPWPCPPGTGVGEERVRAPSGLEARVWNGGWRDRTCIRN